LFSKSLKIFSLTREEKTRRFKPKLTISGSFFLDRREIALRAGVFKKRAQAGFSTLPSVFFRLGFFHGIPAFSLFRSISHLLELNFVITKQ